MDKDLPDKVIRVGKSDAAIWISKKNGKAYVQFSHRVKRGTVFLKSMFRYENMSEMEKLLPQVKEWIRWRLAQGCIHEWFESVNGVICKKCWNYQHQLTTCDHTFQEYPNIIEHLCNKCGMTKT